MSRRSTPARKPKTAAERGVPALADGRIPQPGDRVQHDDGTIGTVQWTDFGTLRGPRVQHDVWFTVVAHEKQLRDGTLARETRIRLTSELRPC